MTQRKIWDMLSMVIWSSAWKNEFILRKHELKKEYAESFEVNHVLEPDVD